MNDDRQALTEAVLALSVAGPNDWYRRESPELGQAYRRAGVSAMADMIALVIMGQRKRTGLLADNPDAGVGQVSRVRPGKGRAETSACAGYVNKSRRDKVSVDTKKSAFD